MTLNSDAWIDGCPNLLDTFIKYLCETEKVSSFYQDGILFVELNDVARFRNTVYKPVNQFERQNTLTLYRIYEEEKTNMFICNYKSKFLPYDNITLDMIACELNWMGENRLHKTFLLYKRSEIERCAFEEFNKTWPEFNSAQKRVLIKAGIEKWFRDDLKPNTDITTYGSVDWKFFVDLPSQTYITKHGFNTVFLYSKDKEMVKRYHLLFKSLHIHRLKFFMDKLQMDEFLTDKYFTFSHDSIGSSFSYNGPIVKMKNSRMVLCQYYDAREDIDVETGSCVCQNCDQRFWISDEETEWYLKRGINFPHLCPKCRMEAASKDDLENHQNHVG